MHGDDMGYAETFQKALANLIDGKVTSPRQAGLSLPMSNFISNAGLTDLATQANQAFERYLQLQGEQRFEEAAVALRTLKELLQRLAADDE